MEDNEKQRKTFLNYMMATIRRPNLIVKADNKNNYFKLFLDNNEVKPHLQVVKVAEDGNFYVTNYRAHKNQVSLKIKEGEVVYDLSNVSDKDVSLSTSNNVAQPAPDVNKKIDLNINVRENELKNLQGKQALQK